MKKKFSLKDHLFNEKKISYLIENLSKCCKTFDKSKFKNEVLKEFPRLELKERIHWIRICLEKHLPFSYRENVRIILNSLPPPLDPELSDNDYGDFIFEPFNNYLAHNGLQKADLEFSLISIKEITKRFSSENAIRFFINKYPQETFNTLIRWTKDKNYHVRRLCSEGTRPRLPWSQKICLKPEQTIRILDNLFYDKKRYVTRSVANHMNDITKLNPELAIKTLKKWKKSNKQNKTEMDYIIRHSLRSLIKDGHKNALELLGVKQNPGISVSCFACPKSVKFNNKLELSFKIKAKEEVKLVIDYIVFFASKDGKFKSKKTFKLKTLTLNAGQTINFSKNHLFIKNMTTRKLNAGKHKLTLQINGQTYKTVSFLLSEASA